MSNIIEINNLSFTYPGGVKKAIDSVNLEIKRGEFLVIAGKSGCGKSTLLSHMKKNHIPFGKGEGQMFFTGEDNGRIAIEEMSDMDCASKIGFVGQNTDAQIVSDKVWHEIAFGLENLGTRNEIMRRRTAEISEFMGIRHLYRKDTAKLSGGERQLVMLASVMAMNPEILILDEPINQLSPGATTDFLNILKQINRELAVTIVICEQRLAEVLPLADRVALMHDGRICSVVAPNKIHEAVEEFRNEKGVDIPVFNALPPASRLYIELSRRNRDSKNAGEMPVSVREGRAWLKSFEAGLEGLTIRNAEGQCKDATESKHDSVLEASDVSYAYSGRDYVVKNISLEIKKGSLVTVIGGNGCGKTTLLKCLAGIYKPQAGKIKSYGRCAYLPQDPKALFTEVTAEEELAEVFENYGVKSQKDSRKKKDSGNHKNSKNQKDSKSLKNSKNQKDIENRKESKISEEYLTVEYIRKQVNEMLEFLELEDVRKQHPYDLSTGQMQRLALGKVLLTSPDILLLDEPTRGLDAAFKEKLAEILKKLTYAGKTVVVITHDMDFAAEHTDYGVFMFDGEIVAYEKVKSFFEGNMFFTTQISRMTKGILPGCVTVEDAVKRLVADGRRS